MSIDRRLLATGLGASLLLNIFLLGFAADRLFAKATHPPNRALVPRENLASIPAGDRRQFEAAINARRPAIRSAREMHRAARAKVVQDLVAPTFDRARTREDLAALRRAGDTVREAVQEALLDAMADLPASTRSILVGDAAAKSGAKGR